jgi:hypothetical protein
MFQKFLHLHQNKIYKVLHLLVDEILQYVVQLNIQNFSIFNVNYFYSLRCLCIVCVPQINLTELRPAPYLSRIFLAELIISILFAKPK